MKKQINPTIKAHLIRSAFYLLLLVTVCAIPFALAQSRGRGTAKRSVATPNAPANKDLSRATGPVILPGPASGVVGHGNGPTLPRTSQIPLASSGTIGGHIIPVPPPPGVPQVVLYDQYNNGSTVASLSSTFTDFPTFNADLADDFVVPGGETWNVQSIDADGVYFNGPGPAASFNVFFYADNGGLPGAQVFSATNQPFTQNSSTFTVNLASAAVLTAGTYWVEMQGNMTFSPNGEWGWTDRTVQSNSPAAWQNPGGGFGMCPTWTVKTICIPTAGGPDQVYRLNGTTVGGTPSPTPTGSPTPTPTSAPCSNYNTTTGTGTITTGDTDTGNHCDDCATSISFPFPVSVYAQTFNSANVASNGTLDLIGNAAPFTHGCQVLPNSFWNMAILPYQDDLRTDNLGFTGCAGFPGGNCGIFTSTTGTAPNRQFNIEWRVVHFSDTTAPANFEVVFYENDTTHFDIIYGATSDNGLDETSGVQASATGPATTFSCGTSTLTGGLKVTYSCQGAASPTPTPTGSPTGCQFRVLIAYADIAGQPNELRGQILAEPGVTAVDLFDAFSGTPTLGQLQQYNIVYAFSNNGWADATAMGNVLADYEDAGGVVVVSTFAWDNRGPWNLAGRWMTGGYTPYDSTSTTNFSTNTANITDPGHPLMQGVTSLTAFFRNGVTLTAGAASVAVWTDGPPAVAYKANSGHTAVGLNAYLGVVAEPFTGDWGRVIVNAGRWLLNCQGSPTPTPTGTPSPTPTPTCTAGWRIEPSMLNARAFASGATANGAFYVVTGFNGAYVPQTERFNGTTWANMAPIPTPHSQSRAAAVGNRVYVPGGFNSIQFTGPLNNMQIYDTTTDTWSQGMVLPAARSGVATAAFNGLVYAIGGYNPVGTGHTDVYIYDPVSNSYTTGAPMPVGQGNMPGVLLNGEIYVVGGGTAPGAQFAYNPTANTWRTIAPLPTTGGTCQAGGGFVQDNELWIVGCLGLPINQQVWIYNPGTNAWRAGPQYSASHEGGSATSLFNTRGFVAGGGAGGAATTTVESTGPCPTGTPTPTPTATPTPRHLRLHRHRHRCRSRCTRMVTKCTACKRWTSSGVGRPRVTSTSIATAC
ncbi:MAG: hypothetical protein DME50_13760 [Verrucomicrobia bacterium]|nr:MAG: hypothetical protein DME50_13760 [Verrucomicrobiota bacterium]